jgi:DNA polymerase alpha subunit B
MKSSPDVLILPSKLTLAPKDINGTLVINPGSLAKGSSNGTFAEIFISPMKESDLKSHMDDGSAILHGVAERTRVEIVKL